MAVAAYSALVSLIHLLDNLQHPARQQFRFQRHQIESLHEAVSFMVDLFEDYSKYVCDTELEGWMRLIANTANEAEDVIDSHVVDQMSQEPANMVVSSFSGDLARVTQKIEDTKKALLCDKEQYWSSHKEQASVSLPFPASSMVGFEEHLIQIMDQLTGDEPSLRILPIVGMGGIGKTTLARNAFENPCIVERFDIRTWFTVSQKYSVQEILLGLLHGNRKLGDQDKIENNSHSVAELGEKLYKKLFGRRYLVVMDDLWSVQAWDDIRLYFPNNDNRSRILVTTRLSNVCVSLGNHNSYLMSFLDEEQSWRLLCEKVFREEGCPHPELEKIGKDIAKSCKGLPLALVVIGGLLSSSCMKLEYWEEVAENVHPFVNSGDDERCSNILSLSYSHLPIHLKPCFLYVRVFPEDHEIRVSELIESWIAEGFVRSRQDKTLEEVAYEYLKDLIDRNLILTSKLGYNGQVKRCKIHDVLRDLCFVEHQKNHPFDHPFHIAKVQMRESIVSRNICFLCIVRYANTWIYVLHVPSDASQPTSFVRCYVCSICEVICPRLNLLRLVRVIHSSEDGHDEFPLSTKVRYLDFWATSRLVSTSLRLVWNLQSLIIRGYDLIDLPCEIWEMPQLRHVKIRKASFHDPPVGKDLVILESLQTLGCISNFRCSEEVLERIPNLKKLKICYEETDKNRSDCQLCNLPGFHKLESLNFSGEGFKLEEIAFPPSLKKLVLHSCGFPWEKMTIIGSLPNLEVLKLRDYAFRGPVWDPVEGQFLRLKFLLLGATDLVQWNAEKEHFPKLEKLVVEKVRYLQEIPSDIGEIQTLRAIELVDCNEEVVSSANEIIDVQRSFGNEDLQLSVREDSSTIM